MTSIAQARSQQGDIFVEQLNQTSTLEDEYQVKLHSLEQKLKQCRKDQINVYSKKYWIPLASFLKDVFKTYTGNDSAIIKTIEMGITMYEGYSGYEENKLKSEENLLKARKEKTQEFIREIKDMIQDKKNDNSKMRDTLQKLIEMIERTELALFPIKQ